MSLKGTVLRTGANLLPEIYRPPGGVLLPYAHIVADTAPIHVKHLYSVPCAARFESHLEYLLKHCTPLRIEELEGLPYRQSLVRKFILSFDDGMQEVYENVVPLLRKTGLPAIFFVNSATLDNKRLMWRHKVSLLIERLRTERHSASLLSGLGDGDWQAKLLGLRYADAAVLDTVAGLVGVDFEDYLHSRRPYLTTSEVVELARNGFAIGAHSDNHPHFDELTPQEQVTEIERSVVFLRGLGLPCRLFAFPFHDRGVPISVFKYIQKLGVNLSFGTSEGCRDSVPFSFQRFSFDARCAGFSFAQILKEQLAKNIGRRLTGTELIVRR